MDQLLRHAFQAKSALRRYPLLILLLLLGLPSLAQNNPPATTPSGKTELLAKANALNSEALELERKGEYAKALPFRREIVRLLAGAFGGNNSDMDTARFDLARTLTVLRLYSEARKTLEACLEPRIGVGPSPTGVAEILSSLGDNFYLERLYTNSITYYVRAEKILESLEAPQDSRAQLASVLKSHSRSLIASGDLATAEQLLKKGLFILNQAHLGSSPLAALTLSTLGDIHRAAGFLTDAYAEQTQAVAFVQGLPAKHPNRLIIEGNLASALRDLRRTSEARKIYTNTIAGLIEQRGRDDSDVLLMQRGQARTLALDGSHAEARDLIMEVMARLDVTHQTNSALYASLLRDLGDRQQHLGDIPSATASFKTALARNLALFGEESMLTCGMKERLGLLALYSGDFAQAQELLTSSLAARRRAVEKDPRRELELAEGLKEWAKLERAIGGAARADQVLKQVFTIQTNRLQPNHPDLAETLEQRGLLAQEIRRPKDSQHFHEQALQIRLAAFGATNLLVCQSQMNIAVALAEQGQMEEAARQNTAALKSLIEVAGADHPTTLTATYNHARLLRAYKHTNEAAVFYERALAGFEAKGSRRAAEVASALGLLEVERGRLPEATRIAARAMAAQEKLWNSVLRLGSEQDRLGWQGFSELMGLLAALAEKDPAPMATALLRFKGTVLDSLIEDRQLAAGSDKTGSASLKLLLEMRLRNYRLELEGMGRPDSARPELPAARRELEALEAKMSRESSALQANRRAASLTTLEVRSNLPPGTVLVEYTRYRQWRPQTNTDERFGAMVYQRNAEVRWIDLGQAEGDGGIAEKIRDFQVMMHLRGPPTNLMAVLQTLHNQLWEKVQAVIPVDTQWVMVAPDAEINFVPFAALRRKDHFLGEDLFFRYVASARDCVAAPQTTPVSRSLDIWANPELSRPGWKRLAESAAGSVKSAWAEWISRSGDADKLRGPYLQLAGAEAEGGDLFNSAKALGFAPVKLFVGAEAREAALRQRPAPYVLHMATHGSFLSLAPLPAEGSPTGPGVFRQVVHNPMRSSWLAMAGANETWDAWQRGETPPPMDDGLLTAEEISTLNLRDTWLVTLSACDTGLGGLKFGEGVFGLRRAFAFAGARHLIMTLWEVSDDKSREVMEAVYADALRTNDAAGALARVQRSMMKKWRASYSPDQIMRWAGCYVLNSRGL